MNAVRALLNGSTLAFEEPQETLSAGQTVAFYEGDRVLGGALITETII
ncbi:MAG: hypothetical protein O6951_03490 [Actinobacteria bacterium]|nr:hypothetical protein [Actinomycetota bacterium]